MLILIALMYDSSCGLLDEEKCINDTSFTKSWAGQNRKGIPGGLNSVVWVTFDDNQDYSVKIPGVCPFGTLVVKATIVERNGLPKPNGSYVVPFNYCLYVYRVLKAKHGTIKKLVAFENVYRSKVSGIVTIRKELSLDGFLEDGPREYLICLSASYLNLPESEIITYQLQEDVDRVDFHASYIIF